MSLAESRLCKRWISGKSGHPRLSEAHERKHSSAIRIDLGVQP